MDVLEDGHRSEAIFRHIIPNFSKLSDTIYSPAVQVRNLPWKIMAFPRVVLGPDGQTPLKGLAFFVQCNGDSDSLVWSCNAFAELRIVSQKEGVKTYGRRVTHKFFSKENDWGYSHFMAWNEILDPERGFIKEDTIILEAFVLADVPRGVDYDCKMRTGFVGLRNHKATRYMNSLLHSLFIINKLRKAVYQIPLSSEISLASFSSALQRLFYELQGYHKAVETKRLVNSLGWETSEGFFKQHDVQELCRILLDNVKNKLKGTSYEDTVSQLFEGKMISFLRCKEVDYTLKRVEPFYAIQLNVDGKKNIMEAFKDYCAVEKLEGENKYNAGQYGLQNAEKSIVFSSLPPVLHLHLLRLSYDEEEDQNVIINDRFEFTEKLNLEEFFQSPETISAAYTLHAIHVHSKDVLGDHYILFANPKADGEWFRFEDKYVSSCSKQEAIDHNFGRREDDIDVKYYMHVYMLVYVRDNAIGDVLAPVTEGDVPEQLINRFMEEKRQHDAMRQRESSKADRHSRQLQ